MKQTKNNISMKLISMVDFVCQEKNKIYNKEDSSIFACRVINYSEFLRKPLCKEMFYNNTSLFNHKLSSDKINGLLEDFKTIEHLLSHKSLVPLELTENALKQIGL